MVYVLANLGRGNRLTQRHSDMNDRNPIPDVRKFLKSYVMPLSDDPFHEYEDGWSIKFTVNDKISRKQVATPHSAFPAQAWGIEVAVVSFLSPPFLSRLHSLTGSSPH